MAVALVAMASCSQEETFEPDAPKVVKGMEFVVSDFPAYDDPQTRTIGTPEDGKTEWEEGDEILMIFDSPKYGVQSAALRYTESQWMLPEGVTFKYLEGETPEISALYSPICDVSGGMFVTADEFGTTECLWGSCNLSADGTSINISFGGRTYSRLRIAAKAGSELHVEVTKFIPAGMSQPKTYYYHISANEYGNAYLYGTFAEGATVSVDGGYTPVDYTFSKEVHPNGTIAGKSYALYAGKKVDVDLSTLAATYVINDDAYYTFTGTGSYGIKVESGNPTIILNNVSITVGKEWDNENIVNAIDIVADNSETTVWITGTNNLTSNSGAGIYVKSGSTVIIKSDSRDNILTARAGMDGAGIGGTGYDFSYENVTCGNIYIENITVNAYSSGYMSSNPGIGAITSCGTITIKNATVTALGSNQGGVLYGGEFCPAIGASTVPDIVIENSTINAYRGDSKDGGTGSLADWIGAVIIYDPYSGDTPHTPGIQCGNGYIISTTVNKFLYKASSGVTKEEGSVTYDADGNPTEQAAE